MRKRKNISEDPEEIAEAELMQAEEVLTEEESGDDETENGPEYDPSDESLPAKLERFTRQDDLGNKTSIRLKDILGGEILTRGTFRKQFGLIALCVFYVILYITNRYQAQQELIETVELKSELQKQKFYSLTRSGEYTIRSRQSQVEEMLKKTPDSMLALPKEPPFIIRINTEE